MKLLSKTVNGIETTYQLDGSKIISETTNGNIIWYNYDENNYVIGFEYAGKTYYFEKNAQGDVTRIFDADGNFVSEYFYDAWGNVISVVGNEELAKINPFRYRGYYCDNETGFYYLQSRYYDSYIGRFLNADSIILVNENIRFNNLFTYCGNNPVNYADYLGYFGTPLQWVCATIGGIAGWYFGDYIARKIGLFPGKWWQWQTYAYWTVRGLVVVGGAVLSWVAGTKLLAYIKNYLMSNPNILLKLPKSVQTFASWFLGLGGTQETAYLNQLYNNYASHIFSKKHIDDGIMRLGGSQRQIFNKIMNVIQSNLAKAVEGSNQIHTTINGNKITIRFYIKDGTIQSLDAFVGWASRIIGKLLK